MAKRSVRKLPILFEAEREKGRVVPNLRLVVDYQISPKWNHVSRSQRDGEEIFQWKDEGGKTRVLFANSEALRAAFFAVSTPDDAEEFLKSSGPFRTDDIEVSWTDFQRWQNYFKSQMRLGPVGKGWGAPPQWRDHEILDRIVRVPKFEPLKTPGGNPVLAARAFSVVECIAATNYVDRWTNAVVQACPQCGDPLKAKSKARTFCKTSCAVAYIRANGPIGERSKGSVDAKAAKAAK